MAVQRAKRTGSNPLSKWGAVTVCGLIALFLFLTGSNPAEAQQNSCAVARAPVARLSFINQDPMLDRHRSVRWLNNRANQGSRYMVTGLTEYELQARFDMRLEPVEVGAALAIGDFLCLAALLSGAHMTQLSQG